VYKQKNFKGREEKLKFRSGRVETLLRTSVFLSLVPGDFVMLKRSKRYVPHGLLLALMVTAFSSCASQETGDALPELPESEAAMLDGVEAATPVADTSSSVFADLAPTTIPEGMEASGDGLSTDTETSTETNAGVTNDAFANLESTGASEPAEAVAAASEESAPAAAESNEPFYAPIGGEKLGHVAYILYGSRAKAKLLLEENPSLAGIEKLNAEQKVFFSFDRLRPQAKFLTKDLIDRYPAELAGKLERATRKEAKSKATVAKGETLQALSQRLYGTTRYWTEIYLLNQAAITNYDKVQPGLELTVIQREPASAPAAPATTPKSEAAQPAAPAPAPVAQAPVEQPQTPVPAPAPAAQPVVPAPVPEPVPAPVAAAPVPAPAPVDPIPETPAAAPAFESPAFPAAHNDTNQAPASGPTMSVKEFFANGANVRRLVYVVAILLIGVAAFFLTRTKKKSFDMLDMTTSDTAPRPKLNDKNDKKFG
jgi:nucleoid-associated protein YgaU